MQVEHSVFSTSDDYPTDSFASQTDSCSHLTLESPSLLSVDQFMDMVCWHLSLVYIWCTFGCYAEIFPNTMPQLKMMGTEEYHLRKICLRSFRH